MGLKKVMRSRLPEYRRRVDVSPVRIWLGIIGSQVSNRDGPQPMDRLRDA